MIAAKLRKSSEEKGRIAIFASFVSRQKKKYFTFCLDAKSNKKIKSAYLPLKNYVTILPSRPKPLAKVDRDCGYRILIALLEVLSAGWLDFRIAFRRPTRNPSLFFYAKHMMTKRPPPVKFVS